jgi:hypothetical protein
MRGKQSVSPIPALCVEIVNHDDTARSNKRFCAAPAHERLMPILSQEPEALQNY